MDTLGHLARDVVNIELDPNQSLSMDALGHRADVVNIELDPNQSRSMDALGHLADVDGCHGAALRARALFWMHNCRLFQSKVPPHV